MGILGNVDLVVLHDPYQKAFGVNLAEQTYEQTLLLVMLGLDSKSLSIAILLNLQMFFPNPKWISFVTRCSNWPLLSKKLNRPINHRMHQGYISVS